MSKALGKIFIGTISNLIYTILFVPIYKNIMNTKKMLLIMAVSYLIISLCSFGISTNDEIEE